MAARRRGAILLGFVAPLAGCALLLADLEPAETRSSGGAGGEGGAATSSSDGCVDDADCGEPIGEKTDAMSRQLSHRPTGSFR